MALLKRKSDNEDDDRNLEIQSKRSHRDSEQITISAIGNLKVALTIGDISSRLKDLVGKLVRDELQRRLPQRSSVLRIRCSSSVHHIGASRARSIQLRFTNKVASEFFTKTKIKSEEGELIQVKLVDARSESIIREGPQSSLMIKICVLKGDFSSKGGEDWTADQFNGNILQQREGREPLLVGQIDIMLQNGEGTITNLMLTDSSRSTRHGMFRLGAKVAESSPYKDDIREGVSEPFRVKDCRGQEYEKYHPPSLNDYIWRLEKISKNGELRKRLSSDGITTVKDLFLQIHMISPSALHEKYGIPKKKWEAIIKHANECVMDEYDYMEYIYPTGQQPEQMRLFFNPMYKLVGVASNGQSYCRPETFTADADKDFVETVKQHAYQNLKDWTSVDEATKTSLLSQLAASPHQSLQQINLASGFPTVHQGQPENLPGSSSHHDLMPQSSYAGGDQIPFSLYLDWNIPGSELLGISHDSSAGSHLPYPTSLVQYGTEQNLPPYIPNSAMDTLERGRRKSLLYRILAALKCFI